MFRAGYVALIGRPNAGKSSLINAFVGEKVAIISPKPQTTRDNIIGIANGEEYQIVFVDTPGVHYSKNFLDKAMIKNVRSALGGVDFVVYLADGTKAFDDEEKAYFDHISCEKMLVRTKIDLPHQQNFPADLEISSVQGKNLTELKEKILEKLPQFEEKHYLYDPDYYTDKSVKFLISEEIREKCLNLLHQEVPHGVAVQIISFEENEKIARISADIVCENERHKGMIIGKGGSVLKKIGSSARVYAEELLGKQVSLKLFVRVEKDWRTKPQKIKNLGY